METGVKTRIGILGGTFNPVHLGHLILAQDALEFFDLARVLFVPCAHPPHKAGVDLAPAEHRLAMLEAALEGDLRFEVGDLEIKRGGVSYTVDTVRELRARYPDAELCLIIGSDSLRELPAWHDVYALLELCRVVTITRPGTEEALRAQGPALEPPWPARLLCDLRTGHTVAISSSDIRHRVAEGLSIRYLVHPAVEIYIVEHGLYRK